jgi:ribosomal protein L29
MEIKEIINKTEPDLLKMIAEKRESLRVLRFGSAGAKSKNVKEVSATKKDIARLMTVLNAKFH